MNILVLFPLKLWQNKLSPTRRHIVRALQRSHAVVVTGIGWPDWHAGASVLTNVDRIMPNADALWLYKPLGCRGVAPLVRMREFTTEHPAVVVQAYNECWALPGIRSDDWAATEAIESGTDLMICHHENDLPRVQKAVDHGVAVRHIPHCAESRVFGAHALPWASRDIDVLLTGIIGTKFYPFRARWKHLIDHRMLAGNVVHYAHPGQVQSSIERCDELVDDYAKLLGRSKVHLVCSSRFRYPLAKYVEGAMAGCVTIGDEPELAPEGYDDMAVYVAPDAKEADLGIEVSRWLWHDGGSMGREKSEQAQLMAAARFTMDSYAERLAAMIAEF